MCVMYRFFFFKFSVKWIKGINCFRMKETYFFIVIFLDLLAWTDQDCLNRSRLLERIKIAWTDQDCLHGSCKFCTSQGKKVYLGVVEIMLFKKNVVVNSVAFKKPPGWVDLMPLKIFWQYFVTIQGTPWRGLLLFI